jgi:predicted Zn-dependent protease
MRGEPTVTTNSTPGTEGMPALRRVGPRSTARASFTAVLGGLGALLTTLAGPLGPTPAAAQGIPLIRDTEIERLLEDYSLPIFRAAGLGSQNIAIRIVRHDSFNAFVVDGRNVFINSGTLVQAVTPNEVIGVIAHETGHIAGGHMAALRQRIARDQTKILITRILGIGMMVAGGVSGTGGLMGGGQGVLLGGDEIIMRSLLADRRAQEAAADQAAIRYLSATRQSGRGMLATFERFAQQEYISDTYRDPFVRSHPVASERLAQLRDLVAASRFADVRDPPELQLRHDLMRAKITGYLSGPAVVASRYPPSDNSLPARYARAISKNFANNLRGALSDAEALSKERPDNPYFHELKADFLIRNGRMKEAIEPLRRAARLSKGASLINVRLAQALVAEDTAKALDEAIALCRRALRTDDYAFGYRILANAYYKKGRPAEADLAIAQAHFADGNTQQAKIFAKRALKALKSGSPDWLKAEDIANYKEPT